jgi:hypothetical protein
MALMSVGTVALMWSFARNGQHERTTMRTTRIKLEGSAGSVAITREQNTIRILPAVPCA